MYSVTFAILLPTPEGFSISLQVKSQLVSESLLYWSNNESSVWVFLDNLGNMIGSLAYLMSLSLSSLLKSLGRSKNES